jgi:hypothetical protein
MPVDVDINLRVPAMKDAAMDASGARTRTPEVRFIRRASVAALPTPGEVLHLETRYGTSLDCEVLRADWSEGRDRFTVYCKYAKRSMPPDEYHALLSDPDWERRPLLK